MKPPAKPLRAWDRILALPSDRRDRAIERSCILIYEAGYPPDEADEMALAAEGVRTQQTFAGAA